MNCKCGHKGEKERIVMLASKISLNTTIYKPKYNYINYWYCWECMEVIERIKE